MENIKAGTSVAPPLPYHYRGEFLLGFVTVALICMLYGAPPEYEMTLPSWKIPVLNAVVPQHKITVYFSDRLVQYLSTFMASMATIICLSSAHYRKMEAEAGPLSVDTYAKSQPGMIAGALTSLTITIAQGITPMSKTPIPLAEHASPYVKGLNVTCNESKKGSKALKMTKPITSTGKCPEPIIIGTIRMGFGHHRIAYSACSWGLKEGCCTYFHDLLSIESKEAVLIRNVDKVYSKASRLASEFGGPLEKIWGRMMLSGGASSLRQQWYIAHAVMNTMTGLPKDIPVITSHSLVGMVAVVCGFKTVINCVIDNHAQWFTVVPGAVNLVQGPANYQAMLNLGVSPSDIHVAGHWCPADLVDNIPGDCEKRAKRAAVGKPRRLLIPIGGAGAQKIFIMKFLDSLKDLLKEGKVTVNLNCGDHHHVHEDFRELLRSMEVKFVEITDINRLRKACKSQEPSAPIQFFTFDEYFPAVAATDMLCRISDVLICKPSELAFYPIAKLMIRRVGDHEAYSATRASEIGDGTAEVRDIPDAIRWVEYLSDDDEKKDIFLTMNDQVVKNHSIGIYDGSKNAVKLARTLSARS
eukprot:524084_1